MNNRRQLLQTAASAAILGSAAFKQAWAQAGLPLEQVKVLYGFPPGSAGDICARRIAEKFGATPYSRSAGIVDSRPGAGGQIALNVLKTSPADGTVLAHTPFLPSRCTHTSSATCSTSPSRISLRWAPAQ